MTIPVINQGSLSLATRNADAFSNIAGGNLAQNSQTTVWAPWESFGAKLRRLARDADISNALINAPWTVPAAWVAATAYVVGDTVSNSGSWYVCAIAGTSAGSGGPTSTTTGNTITDNTAFWTYLGGPTIAASDANAATVTTSTSGTPTGLTNLFGCTTFPSLFKITGGYSSVFSTSYWNIKTFDQKVGSTATIGGEITFETDAPKFAVGFTSGTNAVRVVIDGRYHTISSQTPAAGATPNWIIFDFGTTSARKRRTVTIEGGKAGFNFAGVRCTSNDMVYAPTTQEDVRAVFISDSLMAGSSYGPFLSGGSVPQRVGKLLGWNDCWNYSIGGTGYVNPGASSYYTYGQRVTEGLTRTPDVWVFMGSTNDTPSNGYTAAQVTAAALAAFQAIRTGGSSAPIIVLGVWPLNNSGVSATETAVQAAVTAFADPLGRTYFIPIYADANLPWVTGAWNNTANTSSTNATMYIAGDNTHPADIGTAYLSSRIATAIRTNVLASSGLSFPRAP